MSIANSYPNGVIQPIAMGGAGSEAKIRLDLRTKFPGLGGTIVTKEGVVAALRIEYNSTPRVGHKMFIRHMVAKKLDDHFYRSGIYVFSHIPRAFGSISLRKNEVCEAYIYEWTFGSDGFPWVRDGTTAITLSDWTAFVARFVEAGIDVKQDITDADDGRYSQNIVHQYPHTPDSDEMSPLWKRIDFGFNSMTFNLDRLEKYMSDSREDLLKTLRSDRYQMLRLAIAYLRDAKGMSEYNLGRLEQLIVDYRLSSLRHFAYGFGPAGAVPQLIDDLSAQGSQSLLGLYNEIS